VIKRCVMNNEIWKSVRGYEGIYEISNMGSLRRLERIDTYTVGSGKEIRRPLKGMKVTTVKKDGRYWFTSLSKNGKRKNFYIHRLVAYHFIGEIPPKMVVNHLDMDINNNRADNLEIVSNRENYIHGARNKNHSSEYIGVSWNTRRSKWIAMVRNDAGSKTYLGAFNDEEDARDAVLREYKSRGIMPKYLNV